MEVCTLHQIYIYQWYIMIYMLTISALIQNELYLIARQIKKNAEDKTL